MTDSFDNDTQPQILVVDDSKVIRRAAEKILSKEYAVITAEDGQQAWELLQQEHHVSVVFTDLSMPGLTGYELLETIRSADNDELANLPVIIITGAEETEGDQADAVEKGATDFIRKPFDSLDLKTRAAAHINYRREIKKLADQLPTDTLTGLLTQSAYFGQGEQSLAYAQRHGTYLTTVRFDLLAFSNFFVRFGKKVAEKLLTVVAAIIKEEIRKEDYAARIGVSNFALLLLSSNGDGAETVINRICERLATLKLKTSEGIMQLDVAAGISSVRAHDELNFEELNNQAESALVDASNSDSKVVYFQQPVSEQTAPIATDDTLAASTSQAEQELTLEAMIELAAKEDSSLTETQLEQAMLKLIPLLIRADEKLELGMHSALETIKSRRSD